MKINQYHGKYNISTRKESPKFIVCHYTGSGTSKSGSAKNNCIYFSGGNRKASAHYFIDDGGIWEYADPSEYYTWHCGDGHGKYGITNANSIGIEVCLDGDNPYTETEIGYLTELVTYLMKRYSIPANKIVRHFDASRKSCPMYYAKRGNEWDKLHSRITTGKAPAPTTSTSKPTVSAGNSITKKGQKFLQDNGFSVGKSGIDGKCGPDTRKAMIKYVQYQMTMYGEKIPIDGSNGPKTRASWKKLGYVWKGHGKTRLIKAVQVALLCRGYDVGSSGVDGKCGPATDSAIRKFQKGNGLSVDGHVGPATFAKLF